MTMVNMNVVNEIMGERARQDEKWGGPEHDDLHNPEDWCNYIIDYATWAKQMAAYHSFDKYRRRMIQVAALAVAACDSFDRKTGKNK